MWSDTFVCYYCYYWFSRDEMIQRILKWLGFEAKGLLRRVPHPKDLYFKELLLGEYKRKKDYLLLAPLFPENQYSQNVCWAEAWANALAVYYGEQISVKWFASVAWQKGWCSKTGAELKVAGDIARKRLLNTYGFKTEKELPSYEEKGWDEITNADISKLSDKAIGSYYFCADKDDILQALDSGYPVVVGRYWTNKFNNWVLDSDRNSNMAHATLVVGYSGDNFIEQNSWGKDWGINNGKFYSPIKDIQQDIDTFGAIAVTPVPYTPKTLKVKSLLEQLKFLQIKLKNMISASNLLYGTAKGLIGQNLRPDLQPLACAGSITEIINRAFQENLNIVGTGELLKYLQTSPKWEKIDEPEKGCVGVVSTDDIPSYSPIPLFNGKKHGHCWIYGQYASPDGSVFTMSNNSDTEKWDTHWTARKIDDYFVKWGKCQLHLFRRKEV